MIILSQLDLASMMELEWTLINYFIDTHIKNKFQFMMLLYMLKYECGFVVSISKI